METTGSSLTAAEVRALEGKHRKLLILCLQLEELATDFDAGESRAASERSQNTSSR